MKKIFSLVISIALALTFFAGCGNSKKSETATKDIKIASLKGPTSIGLAKLYTDDTYSYSIYGAADEISTGLVKGEIDIAAIPANLASILYNKTEGKIKIAGINTLGVLYILSKGIEINSVADLKGQTIYTTGQGTTPEYTLKNILAENNIDPQKDVTMEFFSEAAEVVAHISTMDQAIAMLPEPYVEVAKNTDSNLTVALDLTKEWEKIDSESTIVTGVVVVRSEFLDKNAKAFDAFMKAYDASVNFANNNVEECADMLEKLDIFKAAIAKKAIPNCNVTLITGQELIGKLSRYYTALYNINPSSIGGNLVPENGYYTGE